MPQLRVFLLGTPRVEHAGKALKFPQHKALALLAYLALNPGAHSRERLATLLWPESDATRARDSLRDILWRLKQTPLAGWLDADREGIELRKNDDLWVDVSYIQSRLAACRTHGHAKSEMCPECIPLLTDAVGTAVGETGAGDFMAGFTLKDSVDFDDWQSRQAESLREQLSGGLERLVRWHSKQGAYQQAITYARRWVALDPLHEVARQQLMRVYALHGQNNLAMRLYRDYLKLLESDLGVLPAAETTRLYEDIRAGRIKSLSPDGAPFDGAPFDGAPSETPSPPQPSATPMPAISAPPPSLAGERRIVTVLDAKIQGSAALAEQWNIEAWTEMIEQILQILSSEVQRYGGELYQYRQDGLVALFGAPTTHENDPERAVLAALALQDALRRIADLPPALALGVGVSTGEVVILAGSDGRQPREKTVRGLTLNLAAVLAEATDPGSVLVAEPTYSQVAPLFTWQTLGRLPVMGGRKPLELFRPLAHQRPLNKGRGIVGLQSPLVGRAAELRDLQKAIERVRAGLGGIVTVVGEAGIGKSRLVAELKSRVENQKSQVNGASADPERPPGAPQPKWIEGCCLSYAANVAYQVWLDMLRSWLEAAPGADPVTMREKLRAQVDEDRPDAVAEVYPFLVRLLSLPPSAGTTTRLQGINAEGLQVLTFRAIEMWIEGVALRRPLILVCEDLHWADPTSLALLEHLFPMVYRVPLLLVCVMRPATDHACWRIRELAARDYRQRHTDRWLEPLSPDQSNTLIGNLLPMEELPAHLRDHILERADGNPFFLEEILRSLIAYDDPTGRWYTTREIDALAIPDTLLGVLTARIDRLPRPVKNMLQLAAVIGHTFPWRVLESVAQAMGIADLESHLVVLQRAQLIRELPEREYTFEHVLTREAAYSGLLKSKLRAIHRQVAEALERLYPERIKKQPGLLAYHWEQSGNAERAAAYLRSAGEQAAAQFANVEAVDYLSRALALLPETDDAGRYAVLAAREAVYDLQGERDAQQQDLIVLAGLSAALDTGQPQTGHSRRAEIALRQSRCAHRLGQDAAALTAAQAATQLAQAAQDVAAEASGYREWGRALWHLNKPPEAFAPLEQALAIVRQAALLQVEIEVLHSIGGVYNLLGNPVKAQFYWEQELHLCQETGNRRSEGEAWRDMGTALHFQGKWKEALPYFEQSLVICRATGDRHNEGWALILLGENHRAQDRYAEGETYGKQALALFREIKEPQGQFRVLSLLYSMAREKRPYEKALTDLAQKLRQGREIDDLAAESAHLQRIGRSLQDRGNYPQAQQYLEQSLILFRATGDQSNEGRTLIALGENHWAQSHYTESETYGEQALALFREIEELQYQLPALFLLFFMAREQERYEKALAYSEQALQLSRKIGDHTAERSLLKMTVDLLQDQGNYTQAQQYLEQARQISSEIAPEAQGRDRLFVVGRRYFRQGDYSRANTATESCLRFARDTQNTAMECWGLLLLGYIHHRQGNVEKAQQCGRPALRIAQALHDDTGQSSAWCILGHAAAGFGHWEEAILAYTHSLEILQKSPTSHAVIQDSSEVQAGLARAILAQGNMPLAMIHVEQILAHQHEQPLINRTTEPFWGYLTCYQILQTCADPRAPEVLHTAYVMLQERAAKIEDAALRRSYLENVPYHRGIIAEWERRAAEPQDA